MLKVLQMCAGGLYGASLKKELEKEGCQVLQVDFKNVPGMLKISTLQQIEMFAQEKGPFFILPHTHEETLMLAQRDGIGWGWSALVPSVKSLKETHDKLALYQMLKFFGFPVVSHCERAYVNSLVSLNSEYVYKPIEGAGSRFYLDRVQMPQKYVEMSRLDGEEYTIDLLAQRGYAVDWCARKRIHTSGGICVDAKILGVWELVKEIVKSLCKTFVLNGPYAIQGFYQGGEFYITDINARFGGGSMMSVLAGWKGVRNYVRLAQGKSVEGYGDYVISKCRVRRSYQEEIV